MISVILPTFNEAANMEEVLHRAAAALRQSGVEFELIVVDDSTGDKTAEIAASLQGEIPLRILRRNGRLGLATAVVEGWKLARGDILGVMDADLQHPPEILTALLKAIREPGVDLVIASRRAAGGEMGSMPLARRLGSGVAASLAAFFLPGSVGAVRDPMSGMFLIRASALEGVQLQPTGYKILLEVLVKGRYRQFEELPYTFERRGGGSSKMGPRQIAEYFEHLWRLARFSPERKIWLRYLAAGSSGVVLNLSLVYLAVVGLGWAPAWAVPASIQLAWLETFVLHQQSTFAGSRVKPSRSPFGETRFRRYEKLCLPGGVLNAVATVFLARLGVPLLLAAGVGVAIEHTWHFFGRISAVWQLWKPCTSNGPEGSEAKSRTESADAGVD